MSARMQNAIYSYQWDFVFLFFQGKLQEIYFEYECITEERNLVKSDYKIRILKNISDSIGFQNLFEFVLCSYMVFQARKYIIIYCV